MQRLTGWELADIRQQTPALAGFSLKEVRHLLFVKIARSKMGLYREFPEYISITWDPKTQDSRGAWEGPIE